MSPERRAYWQFHLEGETDMFSPEAIGELLAEIDKQDAALKEANSEIERLNMVIEDFHTQGDS